MYLIKEINLNNISAYDKYISLDEKNYEKLKEVKVRAKIIELEEMEYYVIYDSDMQLDKKIFEYLNIIKKNRSQNTKKKALYALKFFYSYCELFNLSIENISTKMAYRFLDFLAGKKYIGKEIIFETQTKRNAKTVNEYVSYVRDFLNCNGIIDTPFSTKKIHNFNVNQNSFTDNLNYSSESYEISLKTNNNSNNIIRYINEDQIKIILETVRKEFILRDEVIIRLMFECGLRIGEVLGLTIEDLKYEKHQIMSLDDMDFSEIIIMNRLSDKYHQNAKTCLNISSYDDYLNIDIDNEIGIEKVYPSNNLIKLIDRYIKNSRKKLTKITRKNYLNGSKADRLSLIDSKNYYLIINKNGNPLGINGWNKRLKKIFSRANIKYKKNNGKDALSHKFRHGHGMFLKKNTSYNEFEIMKAMRHKNIKSTEIYIKNDRESIQNINEIKNKLFRKKIPNLYEEAYDE